MDLKQPVLRARFPWRTWLAKPQIDVFVPAFLRMPTTKQTCNLESYTWLSSAPYYSMSSCLVRASPARIDSMSIEAFFNFMTENNREHKPHNFNAKCQH
jgi:hypothetical protein